MAPPRRQTTHRHMRPTPPPGQDGLSMDEESAWLPCAGDPFHGGRADARRRGASGASKGASRRTVTTDRAQAEQAGRRERERSALRGRAGGGRALVASVGVASHSAGERKRRSDSSAATFGRVVLCGKSTLRKRRFHLSPVCEALILHRQHREQMTLPSSRLVGCREMSRAIAANPMLQDYPPSRPPRVPWQQTAG